MTTPPVGRSLGIGLNKISDWSTQLPFVDAFKSARAWLPQNTSTWDTKEPLNLDANGWVRSLPIATATETYRYAGTLLLLTAERRSGRYIVEYDGKGTLDYGLDAKKLKTESQPGRDLIQIDGTRSNGTHLIVRSTDPDNTGDYVRNIRVYHEDDLPLRELGLQFNPAFLQKVKAFGTLRFMDWMRTNFSPIRTWAERPQLHDASWAKKGIPVELMVELANETGCSPWFNMPHQATDEYIRNFATYVRDHLDPRLHAYVEFSNEVWNWQFSQAQYALQQAENLWGKSVSGGYMQWYGVRTAQMSEIWKSVFGTQRDRVVAVLATQTGWQGLEDYALNTPAWVAAGNQPAWKSVDAYAVTGYFSGRLGHAESADTVRSWLTEPDGGFSKAFQQLRSGGLLPGKNQDSVADTLRSFQYQAKVAQKYGLQLVAYEGGQHIVGISGIENDTQLTNFFIALNRRPEMQALYQQLLDGWYQAGGTLFNHFVDVSSSDKWGSWGALESLNQTTSPKYAALMDFISTHNRWWNEPTSGLRVGQYQRGTATHDTLSGGGDGDTLLGGAGNDRLYGHAGNDRVHGESGDDRIEGGSGDDRLAGGDGTDTLIGGDGRDILIGGAGYDTLTGGAGRDYYLFDTGRAFVKTDLAVDAIEFISGDRLVLDTDTFTSGTSFTSVATDADASTNAAFITYSRATGRLFYNQNGAAEGLGTGGKFAYLHSKPALVATDFLVTQDLFTTLLK